MLFLFLGNDILDENHSWPEKMELEDMVEAIKNMKDDERKTKIFLYINHIYVNSKAVIYSKDNSFFQCVEDNHGKALFTLLKKESNALFKVGKRTLQNGHGRPLC